MLPPKDTMRSWSTWLPAMMDCLLRTDGDVLEIGGGFGTAVLRAYCENYRKLLTVEANDGWRKWLMETYPETPFHSIAASLPETGRWDVALVDGAPASSRQPMIEALRNRAKLIVVHDTEPGNFTGYGYDFSGFEHVANWNDLVPNSSVLTCPSRQ